MCALCVILMCFIIPRRVAPSSDGLDQHYLVAVYGHGMAWQPRRWY
jgi:hypothetical protein